MRRARFIFIMVLPAILFPMIFTYYPMIKGSLMAFQSYNLMNVKNIKWVGLENFSKLFAHNTSNTFHHAQHGQMGGNLPVCPVYGGICHGIASEEEI